MKLALNMIIIAVVVAFIVLINCDQRDADPQTVQLTLSLIKDKVFLSKVKSGPQKEKEIVLTEAAKILLAEIHTVTDNKHKDFVADDFVKVTPVIDFMLAIDSINGHAIYFKGEVYRLLNDYDRFTEYFQKYLNIEDSIKHHLQKVTDSRLCYETSHGYCEQRTAWISQLLANYYYKRGLSESDFNIKMQYFNIAMRNIQNVRIHLPAGFDASSVTMSTSEIETNLKSANNKLHN